MNKEMSKMSFGKYLEPVNYARKGGSLFNKYILHYIDIIKAPSYDTHLKYPPIFFLGAPRSGSTLMMQVLTDSFDFGYISNRHCQFFGMPYLAEKLFHPLKNKKISDYKSYHGITREVYAPSECGEWWYRFFRRKPAYVPHHQADSYKMRCFRRSIASLISAFDRPVLFKNLYATLRIRPILEYIPEALFIIVKRNEIDNGHSLLEARFKVLNTYDNWWSMEPPSVDQLKRFPAHVQVIEQIRHIYALIDQDIAQSSVSRSRFHQIEYEDFCSNVHDSLSKFDAFLKRHGVDIDKRFVVPERFQTSRGIHINENLYKKMKDYVNART
jgi:Sulfotransferase family